MYDRGRDMTLCHRGMRISESDWKVFLGHAAATLEKFQVPAPERDEVVAFVQSEERSSKSSWDPRLSGSIDVGDQISAETGQMNGPTCTGVADRVGTGLPANGALQDLLMLPGWQRFLTDFTDVNRIRKQRVECSA